MGVVDLKRKKGRKVASLSVFSMVNTRHVLTIQFSGGILRGWSRCRFTKKKFYKKVKEK